MARRTEIFCGREYTRGKENMRLEEPHTANVRFLEPHVCIPLTSTLQT